jgi:hypothetical protein
VQSLTSPITIHYRLIWDCVPFLSPLTTRRDCGGSILTRLHTDSPNMLWYTCLIKHAITLLRTKDCCTYLLLHAQQDALPYFRGWHLVSWQCPLETSIGSNWTVLFPGSCYVVFIFFVVLGYITEVGFLLINLFFCSFQYILVSLLSWCTAVVPLPEAQLMTTVHYQYCTRTRLVLAWGSDCCGPWCNRTHCHYCWLVKVCECILLRSILVMNKNNHHSQYICDFYY